MSLRDSIQIALLLAIGTLLHLVIPGYGGGIKPDLLLSMLFIILMMYKNSKTAALAGFLAGLLSALTTSMPGGQIPNVVDKLITTIAVYFLIKYLSGKVNSKIISLLVGIVGTLISGSVFLLCTLIIVGLPASFEFLFATVVLPATLANAIVVLILYPVVVFSKKTIETTIAK
ncbi:MAG: tryptophan transporter [Zhaonellaceae bacterium]|jgi:hypothetical protein|nr:tryptophan transporter [Clostridia bacterium]